MPFLLRLRRVLRDSEWFYSGPKSTSRSATEAWTTIAGTRGYLCIPIGLSSSFLGVPSRILNINHKKELLRGLWGRDRLQVWRYESKRSCGSALTMVRRDEEWTGTNIRLMI